MRNNIAAKVNIHAIWRIHIKIGSVHAIIAWIHTLVNSASALLTNGAAARRNGAMRHRPTNRLSQAEEIPLQELRQPAAPLAVIEKKHPTKY